MLKIGFDAGFDTAKLVSEDTTFPNSPFGVGIYKYPFNIYKMEDTDYIMYNVSDNYITFSQESQKYFIGDIARDLIYSNKDNAAIKSSMEDFYSEKRFLTDDAIKIILSGIGLTIASTLEDDSDTAITVAQEVALDLALPAQYGAKLAPVITEKLEKRHLFQMEIGQNKKVYKFDVTITFCEVSLQAIDAIIASTSDDNGNIISDEFDNLIQFGSTYVLDGGYGTFGIIPISAGGVINPKECKSLEEFAMKSINQEVSKLLALQGKNFPQYTIEQIMNGKNKGKLKGEDITLLRAQAQATIVKRLVDYLCENYNNLDSTEKIALTGGTCKAIYQNLKEALSDYGFTDERLVLLTAQLRGETVPIEFTIAVGAYKCLCSQYQNE